MKKLLFNLGKVLPIAAFPLILVSCGNVNPLYLAQKDLRAFLQKIENKEIDFSTYQNKEAVGEIKYIEYLLNSSKDKQKYKIDYFPDEKKMELKIYVPFLEVLDEKNITKNSVGRIRKVAHANHFHLRFVTYDELPLTEEEKEQLRKPGYTYTFKKQKDDDTLDFSKVELVNDFSKYKSFLRYKSFINLSENSNHNNYKVDKDKKIDFYEWKIKPNFFEGLKNTLNPKFANIENWDTKELQKQTFLDAEDHNFSWKLNAKESDVLLSDAAFTLGNNLIKSLVEFDKEETLSFGFDEKKIQPKLLNWWLVHKPGVHEKEGGKAGTTETINGLLDLDKNQLGLLNNVNTISGYEAFLSSLTEEVQEEIKNNVKKFDTPPTKIKIKKSEAKDIKFYYFKDENGKKRYLNNITPLVKALYGDLISVDNEKGKSFILLDDDARFIKEELFEVNNPTTNKINLGFSVNLEKALTIDGQNPVYYYSNNNKIFKKDEDRTKWLNSLK